SPDDLELHLGRAALHEVEAAGELLHRHGLTDQLLYLHGAVLHELERPVVGAADREAADDLEIATVDLEGGYLDLVVRAAHAEDNVFAAVLHVLERALHHLRDAGRVDHDVEAVGGELLELLVEGVVGDDDIARAVRAGQVE